MTLNKLVISNQPKQLLQPKKAYKNSITLFCQVSFYLHRSNSKECIKNDFISIGPYRGEQKLPKQKCLSHYRPPLSHAGSRIRLKYCFRPKPISTSNTLITPKRNKTSLRLPRRDSRHFPHFPLQCKTAPAKLGFTDLLQSILQNSAKTFRATTAPIPHPLPAISWTKLHHLGHIHGGRERKLRESVGALRCNRGEPEGNGGARCSSDEGDH